MNMAISILVRRSTGFGSQNCEADAPRLDFGEEADTTLHKLLQ